MQSSVQTVVYLQGTCEFCVLRKTAPQSVLR
jgi:hypothetical protein